MIGRLLCKLRLHKWDDVGVTAVFLPVRRCRRCGWFEVFTGYACILYPPESVQARQDDS